MRAAWKTFLSGFFFCLTIVGVAMIPMGMSGCQSSEEPPKTGIPILTYHRVVTHEIKEKYFADNKWVNDLDLFKQNMKYLCDNGYKTLSMDEFYEWYCGRVEYDVNKTVLLTFDDGHIENYHNVLPVLKEYGFKATLFVIGACTEDKTVENDGSDPTEEVYLSHEMIDSMRAEYPSFEIQSHMYGAHDLPDENGYPIQQMSYDELQLDFARMRAMGCSYYAYPFGVKTDDAARAFESSGFKLGFGFGQNDLPYRRAERSDLPYYIARIKVDHFGEQPDAFAKLLQ